MRGSANNGRTRLLVMAAAQVAAVGLTMTACAQAQASSAAVTKPGTSAVTAGSGGWRLLARQRPEHSGDLYVLVALPHGRAWAFGEYGQRAPYGGYPIAEYWNGSVWLAAKLPSSVRCGPIAAAGASSAGNVWAVGTDGCVLRLAGRTWKVAKDWTAPRQLTGITVLGRNDVWVFGGTDLPAGRPGLGTWHYNGRNWRQVHGIGGDVQTASAASAGDIWAIGLVVRGEKQNYFLEHYSGGTWHQVTGVTQPRDVLAAGREVWVTDDSGPVGTLERRTSAGGWAKVPIPGKLSPGELAADGHGGIWLTTWVSLNGEGSVRNEAVHLSDASKWTKTPLTTGAAQLALSRIPGTTSMLALGLSRTDAALFGYGRI